MKKNHKYGAWYGHAYKKTFLVMRLVLIISLVCIMQSFALNSYTQNSKVSLTVQKMRLEDILMQIENKTKYRFAYNRTDINVDKVYTINVHEAEIEDVLDRLFANKKVSYSIVDERQVVLSKPEGLLPVSQQSFTISGKVKDSSGVPLPGVTVVVKGTTEGTITDTDGKYSLSQVPSNATLVFSFVGMRSQEIPLNGKTAIDVVLQEETIGLEEVVAVGYGTMKKSDLTGAISRVSADEIKDRSKTNVMESLAGKVAGVQILQTDGTAGFSPTVKVRGAASVTAGTTPLYVVDGIPIEDANLNIINPSDIESMEILKDASSAAIYGSRGSNGVVIITTKSGKTGKTNVEFNYEKGFSTVGHTIDMMNAQEYIKWYVDARNNSWIANGGNASDSNDLRPKNYQVPEEFITNPEMFGKGTDWQDVVFRTAQTDNASLNISGGNEKTKFLISMGYLSQDGIVDGNSFERVTLRSNLTHNILPNLTVGTNILLTKINEKPVVGESLTPYNVGKSSPVSYALQDAPIYPVYNENGNYGPYDPNSEWNRFVPYQMVIVHPYVWTREMERKMKSSNSLVNGFLEWKFFQDFKFRTSLSAIIDNSRYNLYQHDKVKYGWDQVPAARAYSSNDYKYNWIFENTITYEKNIGEHAITVLLGYSAQEDHYEDEYILATGFPNDEVHTLNAAETVTDFSSSATEWSLLSYIGRINYSYQGKYLLTATLRRDGCSRFGERKRWGYFPSASLGWRVSEEDFMQSSDWLSNLKLRMSYGVTGNNQIDNYGSIGLLNQTQYAWGEDAVSALYVNTISNSNLKWEKTGQLDVGLSLGLFSNRIYMEFDFYHSKTKDMLLNVPVPALTGFTSQLTNIGKIRNNGIELLLSTKNLTGKFKWDTDFNISRNKNKVLKLGADDSPIYTTNWGATTKTEIGKPMANFYGYIFDGVFMNQNEVDNYPHVASTTPGDPKIRDVNGDQVIDENDRTIIGNYQPDFVFGITNSFNYKNFDFSFTLQGQYGNEIINSQTRYSKVYSGARNQYAVVNNYWKSESDPGDGKIFKPMATYNGLQTAFSTYWVEDGSFLRIRNMQLGYNLPKQAFSWGPFSSARLYVNIENLYVFTNYKEGFDPENSAFSGLDLGQDYGASPMPRTITLGIKLNL